LVRNIELWLMGKNKLL